MTQLRFDGRPNQTRVGYFTYTVADDHWSWSEGMFVLHGYEPYAVAATTELVLQHKHPDDAVRAFAVLEAVVNDGQPFSCYHRIVDASGRVRYVLSVGRGLLTADGRAEQVTGFIVDLTEVRDLEVRRAQSDADSENALLQVSAARAVVDQAKGIVMATMGCDDAAAFALLRKCCAHQDLRLQDLAGHLRDVAAKHPSPEDDARREAIRGLLGDLAP